MKCVAFTATSFSKSRATSSLMLAGLLSSMPLASQERIQSYDTHIEVRRDGGLDVVERIAVRAEGQQIRRGIYRDFPTRYRDRLGNRVSVDLEVIGVERNGRPEPWFTERVSNGIRINTGDDSFLPVPAEYTFALRYRTTRQLGFFAGHDELYWNAIGTGWVFPIERGTVEVRLPAPVPINRMSAEGYTGEQGSKGSAYVAELPAPGMARYRLTKPLAPNEGFTVVLTFPKGLITEPSDRQRTKSFLADNRGVLIALAGLIALVVYALREWRRVGRDPQKGTIIARYEPPPGKTPAGLRYMRKMGYDMRCFTADVVALAVGGDLRIHRDDGMFKDEWKLDRTTSFSQEPSLPSQLKLLDRLFKGGKSTLVLKETNAATISAACQAHQKALSEEFNPRYFRLNGRKVGVAVVIGVVTGALALIGSGGFGIPAIIAIIIAMLITIVVFARLVRAPTKEGRSLLDEIEGVRLYLSVAERDELASMRGPDEARPPIDAKRYEALLPFAVALDVEQAWTEKFTHAAGAAAAAEAASSITWYSGRGPISNLGDFSNSIGSGLSSQISSASTPPGSSSGSGGGGSSGGGGGGGGGGGR